MKATSVQQRKMINDLAHQGLTDRQIVRELIETKTPLVLQDLPSEGAGWQVFDAHFARSGFTPTAIEQLQKVGGLAIDLNDLDAELGHGESHT